LLFSSQSPDELADLALRRASAFDGLEDWEECRNAADNAVNNRPTDLSAYMLRGKAESKLGLHADALRTYSEVLRRWKSHPGAFNARAEVLIATKRLDDAVIAATNAINVATAFYNPSHSRAELESALETIGLEGISGSASEKDLRSELAEYQKTYQLEGFQLLAAAQMELKNNKAALEAVNSALKVDPSSAELKDLKMKVQDAIIAQSS
jgi:tetratricopeptide (TPR) repeat protein